MEALEMGAVCTLPGDAQAVLRPHRHDHLGRRPLRQPRPGQLRRRQARRPGVDERAQDRGQEAQHQGQRGVADRRHPDGRQGVPGFLQGDDPAGAGGGGGDLPGERGMHGVGGHPGHRRRRTGYFAKVQLMEGEGVAFAADAIELAQDVRERGEALRYCTPIRQDTAGDDEHWRSGTL